MSHKKYFSTLSYYLPYFLTAFFTKYLSSVVPQQRGKTEQLDLTQHPMDTQHLSLYLWLDLNKIIIDPRELYAKVTCFVSFLYIQKPQIKDQVNVTSKCLLPCRSNQLCFHLIQA